MPKNVMVIQTLEDMVELENTNTSVLVKQIKKIYGDVKKTNITLMLAAITMAYVGHTALKLIKKQEKDISDLTERLDKLENKEGE